MEPQKKQARSIFRDTFLSRVAKARAAAGHTQAEMAVVLGMKQDKYKQYESRSLLPHHLVAQFCTATKIDPAWLFGLPARQSVSGKRRTPNRAA